MNLTWHVVRKDLRRFAWPVSAWVAFVALGAGGLLLATWAPTRVTWVEAGEWMRGLRSGMIALAFIGTSAAVLLAGVLVLEDRVVGSVSFWQTRPIAGGRLLRAKLLAAGILLVAAPVIAYLPVWLAAGFDGSEIMAATQTLVASSAVMVLVALGLAALTANLGQHAFAVLVTVGLTTLALMVLPSIWEKALEGRPEEPQAWLILVVFVLAAVGALVCQYRTRRTGWGWAIWLCALGAVAMVRVFWSWDFSGELRAKAATGHEQRAAVVLRDAEGSGNLAAPAMLRFAVADGLEPFEFLAPMEGEGLLRWPNGTLDVRLGRAETWSRDAARRVADGQGKAESTEWAMTVRNRRNRVEGGGAAVAEFSGRMRFARLRARVLYELPWREGAEASRGGSRTRIVGPLDREPAAMMVEDRRASKATLGVQATPSEVDTFVLVNRKTGEVRDVQSTGHVPVGAGGIIVELRKLTPEPGANLGPDGWTLVKVRFEPVGWFEREFARLAIAGKATEAKR